MIPEMLVAQEQKSTLTNIIQTYNNLHTSQKNNQHYFHSITQSKTDELCNLITLVQTQGALELRLLPYVLLLNYQHVYIDTYLIKLKVEARNSSSNPSSSMSSTS